MDLKVREVRVYWASTAFLRPYRAKKAMGICNPVTTYKARRLPGREYADYSKVWQVTQWEHV